jgi:uncharacterized protein involved in exopolysaccharide biosynthesis
MANLDLKYYWAVFKRRLPYFLVILTLLAAIGITVASILPPVYQSSASLLAEPQQIPGADTATINPFEQIQIVEQRIMTRANLYDLAQRIGLYADEEPALSVGEIVGDMRKRIEFIGFEPDPTVRPGTPGAIIVGVSFDAPTPQFAAKGANELVSLILQENVRMRTDRASDTLDFFQGEVARLSAALADQSQKIADFKTANVTALPDSTDSRRAQREREEQRLLDLQREEAALKNQRATVVWVYERTGRAVNQELSPEETELQNLQSQLLQQQAIYKPESPQIRVLKTRIAALEGLVADQRAARAVPGIDGGAAAPLSELDVELAPIDEQLKYIAEQRAAVEKTLAELAEAQQATPQNEMALADLQRELSNLQTQYDNAVAALGQAQVSEKIEVLSKGQRFTLIDAPIERNTPVSPPRLLIASAGIVGGIGAAVGFIVLWEMLNRSIRRPVELSQGLGIQPVATIPYIRTAGEQQRKRTLIIAVLVLIVIGIPLVLFAINSHYMPLDELLGGVLG